MRPLWRTILYFLFFIALSILLIYFIPTDHTPDKGSVFLTNGNEVEVHYSIFVATLALVFIAYKEFNRSNNVNINELLTFISNRWSSKEIIKARQIIHEIFVYKYRHDDACNPNKDFKLAMRTTSLEIYAMSKTLGKEGKKFVYLLNLLDHFENICYIYNSNKIDLDNIQNIYGNNIIFYYEALEKYIEQRQNRHSDDFKNFRSVYLTLKEKKSKE